MIWFLLALLAIVLLGIIATATLLFVASLYAVFTDELTDLDELE
jgi:hypothetical protein